MIGENMILELDTHIRKIGSLLIEGRWSSDTQKMWNAAALPAFLQFVQRNKHPQIAAHVVCAVLSEIGQQLNTDTNHDALDNAFYVEPSHTINQHSIHLLLLPPYALDYCAREVERLVSLSQAEFKSKAQ